MVTRSNRIPRAELELEAEAEPPKNLAESSTQDVNPLLEMLRASQIQKGKASSSTSSTVETPQVSPETSSEVNEVSASPDEKNSQVAQESSLPESLIFGESLDLDGVEDVVAEPISDVSEEESANASLPAETERLINERVNTPALSDDMETAIFQRPSKPQPAEPSAAEESSPNLEAQARTKKAATRERRISEQIVSKGGSQRAPQTYLHPSPKGKTLQFSISFGEGSAPVN